MNPGCFLIPLFLLNQNPGSKASVGRFKDWNMARNDRYFFSFDTSREQSLLLLFHLTMHGYFCLSIPWELLFYVNAFYCYNKFV